MLNKKTILIIAALLITIIFFVYKFFSIDHKIILPTSVDIEVTNPKPGQIISSPLTISGQAKGTWYFEASFPVKLINDQGKVLAEIPVQAQADWMTEKMVPFSATLNFDAGTSTQGKLIFRKDNPSGLPANDKQMEMTVFFAPSTNNKMTVKAYFGNSVRNPNATECGMVYSVEREIDRTEAVGRAAMEQMLLGPTPTELTQGYYSSINPGVEVQSLTIVDGVAKVDLSKKIEEAVGGSCRVIAIRAQIVGTLKQFPTVRSVVISVDGRVEDVLQP